MKKDILDIIYKERKKLWDDLMGCEKYDIDPVLLASARARWCVADELYKKIEREVKEND